MLKQGLELQAKGEANFDRIGRNITNIEFILDLFRGPFTGLLIYLVYTIPFLSIPAYSQALPPQAINYANLPNLGGPYKPNNDQQLYSSTPHDSQTNDHSSYAAQPLPGSLPMQEDPIAGYLSPYVKRDKDGFGWFQMPWSKRSGFEMELDPEEMLELEERSMRNPADDISSFLESEDLRKRAYGSLNSGNMAAYMAKLRNKQANTWAKRARVSKQVLSYTSGKPRWMQRRNAVNFRPAGSNPATKMLSPEMIAMIMKNEFGKRTRDSWYEDSPILENVF